MCTLRAFWSSLRDRISTGCHVVLTRIRSMLNRTNRVHRISLSLPRVQYRVRQARTFLQEDPRLPLVVAVAVVLTTGLGLHAVVELVTGLARVAFPIAMIAVVLDIVLRRVSWSGLPRWRRRFRRWLATGFLVLSVLCFECSAQLRPVAIDTPGLRENPVVRTAPHGLRRDPLESGAW